MAGRLYSPNPFSSFLSSGLEIRASKRAAFAAMRPGNICPKRCNRDDHHGLVDLLSTCVPGPSLYPPRDTLVPENTEEALVKPQGGMTVDLTLQLPELLWQQPSYSVA